MHKKLCTGLLALLTVTTAHSFIDKKMMRGIIQFPKTVTKVPAIRVYCGGKIVSCDTDHETRRTEFLISENKYQTYFYLLITPADCIGCELEENTIKYLKINPHKSYKFYVLELTYKDAKSHWNIKEIILPPDTGRIPDETIIVCYKPDYISDIKGGTDIEFPKIYIKDTIFELVGSETELHDESARMLLSSLDYDTIHETIKRTIKHDISLKTIIALER